MEPLAFIKKCGDVADNVVCSSECLNQDYLMNITIVENLESSWDSIKQLHEELKQKYGEGEQLELLLEDVRVRFPIGTEVDISGTGYTGVVVKYRDTLGGFYPAIRYPLDIKIIKTSPNCKHNPIGRIFEYSVDQLFRMDLLEQAYDNLINGRDMTSDQANDIEYLRCCKRLLN